jgi:hypothetical protein
MINNIVHSQNSQKKKNCALPCLTVQAVKKLIRNVLFLYNLSY